MAHLLKKFIRIALLAALGSAPAASGQAADPTKLLSGLEGFDFSRLAPTAKRELASVLTDEFDGCGRPLTLLASLKKGDACRHTKRLVGMAAALASEGESASEIIVKLGKYSQSFGRPRGSFKVDERSCLGKADAKVTLVEFSDFECPFCAAVRPTLEALVKERSDVRLCWSAFPLDQHTYSTLCGQAALFARDGGKFWRVHDALFARQTELSLEVIRKIVAEAGLDVKAFDKAVAAGKYVEELKASRQVGHDVGVDGTPSLFINGRRHQQGFSLESVAAAIDDELDWRAGGGGWPSN